MSYHRVSQGSGGQPDGNSLDRPLYDLAEVLVCDPSAVNRAATRSALYSLGCRQVEIASGLREFSDALENRPPDLALCDVQVGQAALCHAIRELRQGEQSYNPFAIIIVTAWPPNAAVIAEILNSGADGLLLRPFSAAQLDQKIQAHVLQRKPFVVTDGYIGPERRVAARPAAAPSFAPPNSLKMKIDGRSDLNEALHLFNCDLQAARLRLADARKRQKSFELRD
jgi:CheY-like chemotaxis protein